MQQILQAYRYLSNLLFTTPLHILLGYIGVVLVIITTFTAVFLATMLTEQIVFGIMAVVYAFYTYYTDINQ